MKRPQFVVLVPVKAPALGKSRLHVPEHVRPGLATAFALDSLHAARETPCVTEVVVVTADPGFTARCAGLGIATLPDGDGLNASLAGAAAAVRCRLPDAIPVALCADLPCLRSEDLAEALAQVSDGGTWFVADAEGTGTTMYAAPYDVFAPRFGTGSRGAHTAAGANEIVGDLASLRRDVDDEATLAEALRLGPGAFTRDAVALLP
jgi:2-phospho-L-lactate guanylyltransferase